ncbi:MAG: mechanosensitive ion channel family protein [Bacteroidetes bacterium]|nr:mechanosensitive ion channel family protein [Bacteroidota bacterium]
MYFVLLLFLLIFISKRIRNWLVHTVLAKSTLDLGTRTAIGTITRYAIILIGLMIILQSVGIDLSTLTVLAGALGVGIGFGLQNVTNNFVSGIIILFERPIKVGDRIEVGNISGDVVRISMRATTVLTNDNISVIVPNSEFISSQVINWSHNDRNVRFNIPVGVSYKEDPQKVKELLLSVADDNTAVLKEPLPDVIFDEFGDSSLNFILRVWTTKLIQTPQVLKSQLYFEIFKRFREVGIEIPFPQRDLHIKNEELNIKTFQDK